MAIAALVLALTAMLVVRGSTSGREPPLMVTSTDDVERRAAETVSDFPIERLATIETAVAADGRGPLLPEAPELTIVAADFNSRLQFVDAASGNVRTLDVFAVGTRSRPRAMQVLGDGVVLDTVRGIVRIPDGNASPFVLASGHRLIPSNDSASMWVFDGVELAANGVASRVDFDGSVLDQVTVPAVARPLAGTGDSLVVTTPTAVSRIVGNAGQYEDVAQGRGLVSDGHRLARLECAPDLSCGIVVGTLDQPNKVRVPLEPGDLPGALFGVPQDRFSPDGRWLALSINQAQRHQVANQLIVMIIDATLGTVAQRVPASWVTNVGPPMAWSPDSRWLAIGTGTRLRMWSAERNAVTELDVQLGMISALAMR